MDDYLLNYYDPIRNTVDYDTEVFRSLMKLLGDPQDRLRFVHVTGSNGKGSTCAMLASVLKKAGLVTGLFTSPFVDRFNERMQINNEQIPDEKLAELVTKLAPIADSLSVSSPAV